MSTDRETKAKTATSSRPIKPKAAAAKPAAPKTTAARAAAAKSAPKKVGARKPAAKVSSKGAGSGGRAREDGHYEQVLSDLKRDFGKARDALAHEFDRAVDRARKRIPKTGVVDEDKLRRAGAEFKEKMAGVRSRLDDARERVADASETLRVEEKARTLADVSLTGLHALASSLRGLAERLEESLEDRRPHFAGDVAEAGSYGCRECAAILTIAQAEALPACRKCGGKKFKHMP